VIKVTDGDTIKLSDGRTIRYIGVDTPEVEENDCFSKEAKEINEKLVLGKTVKIETDLNEIDQFGRTLAYVFVGNILVNQKLLEDGTGKFYMDNLNTKYTNTLVKASQEGYKSKKGIWSSCADNSKTGCVIKGNLDKNDKRYYHLPSFRHYPTVVVNLVKGDQWFCSEKEAQKAGFERARE